MHLHIVYWGGISPNVLQAASLNPILSNAVAKSIDMVLKAEVNPNIHVEYLLKKIKKIIPTKPTLTIPRHPILEPQLFDNDAEWAAVYCNSHQHSSTCYSGKMGKIQCRMAYPKEIIDQTGCFQIEPCKKSETNPDGNQINILRDFYNLIIFF